MTLIGIVFLIASMGTLYLSLVAYVTLIRGESSMPPAVLLPFGYALSILGLALGSFALHYLGIIP